MSNIKVLFSMHVGAICIDVMMNETQIS